MNIERVS